MPLTSEIRDYDPDWPRRYDEERRRLELILGPGLVRIEHVGSTAVPQLAAKPEIDILVIVASDLDIETCSEALAGLGYRRGGDLSEGHHFFKKDQDGVRTHKVHIVVEGHPQIWRMLAFRDHLRSHADARLAYQNQKLKLARENKGGIREYLERKAPLIDRILEELKRRGSDPEQG